MPVQEQAVREAEALPAVEAAGATAEAVADGRSSDGNNDGSQEGWRRTWTSEEDDLIAQLVAQHGKNWALIGTKLRDRSVQECCQRYKNVLDPFFRNGVPWTKEEDLAIVVAQQKLGNSWTAIAQHVLGRTATSIKNRWNSTLLNTRAGLLAAALLAAAANPAEGASQSSSPAPAQTMYKANSTLTDEDGVGVPWTREEDLAIVATQHKLGNSWTAIAKLVPGRTTTAIRSHWNSMLSNKREELLAAALLAAAANPAEGASQSSSPAPAQTMYKANSKLEKRLAAERRKAVLRRYAIPAGAFVEKVCGSLCVRHPCMVLFA